MAQPQQGDALGASYRLIERIGTGAAGDVWKVDSTTDGVTLAAKLLRPEHANDPSLVERFVRERSVLLGLRHTNIVEVRDLVVEGANLAIVMQYVPGGSLRELLDASGPLRPSDALTLAAQVFHALAAAHGQQVTHRDIKPDNVLLTQPWLAGQQDTVRVTDFGVASVVNDRKRQTTGLLGTPQYMAPELISHGQTTPKADVYSAGVMLYELLAGRTPFAGPGTDFTIAYRHVSTKPPKLDLPAPLWDVIARLLAKDPRERPDAAKAATDLMRLAAKYGEVPALERAPEVETFDEIERPATMLRGDLMPAAGDLPDYVSPLSPEAPEIGEAGQQTILRPLPRRDPLVIPDVSSGETKSRRPVWLTNKVIILGAAGVVLLAALGVGIAMMVGDKPAEAAPAASDTVESSQQDQALPTGLSVSRTATFNPSSEEITLEITYAAQRAPLSGDFFQTVPPVGEGSACPTVIWEGAVGEKHQSAATGLKAECGWKLSDIEIADNGETSVTGTLAGTVADTTELTEWLTAAAGETNEALMDPETVSTAYPAQRIQNISVVAPSRTVSQTPLDVTLLPVWPGGPDELNPLFKTPSTGAPSQMLQDIAGTEDGVRFSDGCSGAVAVAPDGVTLTALSVTSDCRLRASVGNFTNLESNPFSITTRE